MNLQQRQWLRQKMNEHLNLDEVQTLCFDLGVDFDQLAGNQKNGKIESLLEKNGRFPQLLTYLQAQYPHVNWSAQAPDDVVCPYKGLFAFQEADAEQFFGREADIARLETAVAASPLIPLIGPSGSGKSSVVFAGLLPRLKAIGGWQWVSLRPEKTPFLSLANALVPLLALELTTVDRIAEARKLADYLRDDGIPLADYTKPIRGQAGDGGKLLIIIDQFEELFTQVANAELRHHFLDCLLAALAADKAAAPTILLTMRADFMGQALAYDPFVEALRGRELLLGPLTEAGVRQAIAQPAADVGVDFEAGLVERVVDDVGTENGRLPLLQFALTQLWELQEGGLLTHAGYEDIGRLEGALTAYADKIYGSLDDTQQQQARRIFTQLVQPGAGTEDTRRLARLSELTVADWPLARELANARLVVTGQDSQEWETLEVVHEALIRQWGRLNSWMGEDRTFRSWQERLRETIRLWRPKEDAGYLLRGGPLAEAEGWLAERADQLAEEEKQFITTSIALRQTQLKAEEARRQQELETAQQLAQTESLRATEQAKARRRLQIGAIVLALAFVGAFVAAIFAVNAQQDTSNALATSVIAQDEAVAARGTAVSEADLRGTAVVKANEAQIEAEHQNRIALAQSISLQARGIYEDSHDAELATLLALEAARINDDEQADLDWLIDRSLRMALHDTYFNHTFKEHTDWVRSVAIDRDGQWLASGSSDNTVRLWDLSKPEREPELLFEGERTLYAVTFSPDGEWLAAGGSENVILLWRTDNFNTDNFNVVEKKLEGHHGSIRSLAFSSDNQWLASGSADDTVRIWDMNDLGLNPVILNGHEEIVNTVAFSSDGHWLASGSDDNDIRLWNLSELEKKDGLGSEKQGHHDGDVQSVAFSPDGQWLVSGSKDNEVRLWDVNNDEDADQLRQIDSFKRSSDVRAVAFSPDGHWLASGSGNDTIQLWEIDGKTPEDWFDSRSLLLQDVDDSMSIAFANSEENGLLLASGSFQTVRVWNIESKNMWTNEDNILSLGFSPFDSASQWVAVGLGKLGVRLLNPADIQAKPVKLEDFDQTVRATAFSPNGDLLATGSSDTMIRLWDLSKTPPVSETLGSHEKEVYSLAFSPDGSWLVTGDGDGQITLWDVNNRENNPVAEYKISNDVYSVAIDQDGQWLAMSDSDSVQLLRIGLLTK